MCSAATSKQKKVGPVAKAAFASSTDFESTFTGHGASGAKNSSKTFLAASLTCAKIRLYFSQYKKKINVPSTLTWLCGNDFKFWIASQNLKFNIDLLSIFKWKSVQITSSFHRWTLCPKTLQTEIKMSRINFFFALKINLAFWFLPVPFQRDLSTIPSNWSPTFWRVSAIFLCCKYKIIG